MPDLFSLDSYTPYPLIFSPQNHAKSMKLHSFPSVKRSTA
ncbi:hypothetical protein PRO82_001338 [Candidatus Protochlamydia amoebophila]|nr:hypothetical protein [Candidatus Protochlamydia amoebophila]